MGSSKSNISRASSKRLLFDRRYGWVIDDWKDPSEEALAGGRGMFCILPLANALVNLASQSINFATSSAVKVVERPDLLQPQALQACLSDQLHKLTLSMQKSEFNLFAFKRNSPLQSTSCCSHLHMESSKSNNG